MRGIVVSACAEDGVEILTRCREVLEQVGVGRVVDQSVGRHLGGVILVTAASCEQEWVAVKRCSREGEQLSHSS